MSLVNILNVQVLDNPSGFISPFKFDITFECIASLEQDLEWKIVYVGSAESENYDQVLDCIMVGPVPVGINKFVFQSDPPNPNTIPANEIAGVTVVLLICSYLDQEFVRVGYYIDNNYEDLELRENPPMPPKLDLLKRNILADKPRVTRFDIKWDPRKLDEIPHELLNVQVDEQDTDISEDTDISDEESESGYGSNDDNNEMMNMTESSQSCSTSDDIEEQENPASNQHPSSSLMMDVDSVPSCG